MATPVRVFGLVAAACRGHNSLSLEESRSGSVQRRISVMATLYFEGMACHVYGHTTRSVKLVQ